MSGSENSTLPVIVTVPRLSTNDVTARLVSWRGKLGDQVVAGQAICEIETTKAVSEVTSPSAGYITPLVDNGAAVAVNAPLAIVSNNIEVNRAAVLAEHYSATHSLGVAHCGAGCSPGTQSHAKGRVIGSALRYYQSIGSASFEMQSTIMLPRILDTLEAGLPIPDTQIGLDYE